MSAKKIVKLCWFHAKLEQYSKVIKDLSAIIVENLGADYENCILCQKYGKMKDLTEGV